MLARLRGDRNDGRWRLRQPPSAATLHQLTGIRLAFGAFLRHHTSWHDILSVCAADLVASGPVEVPARAVVNACRLAERTLIVAVQLVEPCNSYDILDSEGMATGARLGRKSIGLYVLAISVLALPISEFST